jgi:murein DD-endopeptidase MepM/ murein hydrolase activator NlpD
MKKKLLALAAAASLALLPAASALAAPQLPPAVAPHPGAVVRAFDPPDQPWLAGHRGVDLAGAPGDLVVAAAAGTIRFAGLVAGKPVVSIDHGDVITTYEPVEAMVAAGDQVYPGDAIGRLAAGHTPCPAAACLHWGLKEGETYLDPLSLLAAAEVHLISAAAVAELAERKAAWEQALADQAAAGLLKPVDGPVTSGYGYRVNPISGLSELHDGTDFGAACGTPIRAAAAGTVTFRGWYGGYGNRIEIDHGTLGGRTVKTAYNHMEGYAVANGAAVARGEVIGYIGTTGYSTGCHLHFHTWINGSLVDPMTVIGT